MFILLCFSRHALHLLNNFYYMLLLLWKLLKTQPLFYHVLVIQLQLGLSVTIATKMQGNPKKNPPQATKSNNNRKNHPSPPKKAHKENPLTLCTQRAFSLPCNFGQTAWSFPNLLFSACRKPLSCRIWGRKGQMCHGHYQQAAWVWKVTPHLPHEELECEKGRLMGQTQLAVSLQCLHWESVFLPAPWHASMPVLAFMLLRPHRKKAAVFQNEAWCDCSCVLHPVFVTFLAFLLPPPSKSWQDRGTNRHGAIPEMVRYLTGRTFQLGVTLKAGHIIRRGFILLFWQHGGRKQSPTRGRLALQLWQRSDGPFCRSSHPHSSCLICQCPTMSAGENGWDLEGKHPNPSWHSSFRLGRTTVKEQPFCIQCHWKDGTGNRTLCCLYFFQKSLVCCATGLWGRAFERGSTVLQEFHPDLGRKGKASHGIFLFPFSFFFSLKHPR